MSLELQRAEGRHPSFRPLQLVDLAVVVDAIFSIAGDLDPHDEICGVARRTQNTPPRQHLVDGAAVDPARRLGPIFAGREVHNWCWTKKLFWSRIIQ